MHAESALMHMCPDTHNLLVFSAEDKMSQKEKCSTKVSFTHGLGFVRMHVCPSCEPSDCVRRRHWSLFPAEYKGHTVCLPLCQSGHPLDCP